MVVPTENVAAPAQTPQQPPVGQPQTEEPAQNTQVVPAAVEPEVVEDIDVELKRIEDEITTKLNNIDSYETLKTVDYKLDIILNHSNIIHNSELYKSVYDLKKISKLLITNYRVYEEKKLSLLIDKLTNDFKSLTPSILKGIRDDS